MEVNLARMRGKLYELPREISYTSDEKDFGKTDGRKRFDMRSQQRP